METKLQQEVNRVLLNFPDYWEGENLVKDKVIADIRNYKTELIGGLLSSEIIKHTYSIEVANSSIFKIEEFISMLRYKSYWENSYTKFSNEIGLTTNNKYLKYSTDVVLDFPHKDCVLEGGMSSEERGKKEIYYHKVLAKEEIDLLLSPKTLGSIRKFNENGESEVLEITDADNLRKSVV